MESAIFGLLGVVVGGLLTGATEWWFQRRKNQKDAEYLSIQVSCELDRYVARCADVVGDDGLSEGRPDENGYPTIQVKAPKFDPKSFDVEWKSLPANLMYEILDFPYKAEVVSQEISATFEYAHTPPDIDEAFEERQFQYAILGISAAELAGKLRKQAGLPTRSTGNRDPVSYMKKQKSALADNIARRTTRHTHL